MFTRHLGHLLLLLATLLGPLFAHAQYGDEWVESSQTYFRIDIGENGIYKIDYSELQSAGLPVSSINPQHFQLFCNGKEQPMYVYGENDQSFDPGDYLEFYGKRNDGSLDQVLYTSAEEQPHKFMSLYTDTSAYYLTWSPGNPGERFTNFYDANYTGKTSDSFIMHKAVRFFGDEHYDGPPTAISTLNYLTEYNEGEGWFSSYIARSLTPVFQVNTPNYMANGPTPRYKFEVYGKSNPTNPGDVVNGINHEIEVSINGTVLFSQKHFGYSRLVDSGDLDPIMIGSTTNFKFASIYLTRGRHAVSYITVDYPRSMTLNNGSEFEWSYTGNNGYFRFDDFNGSDPWVYDITNGVRIKADVSSGTLQFNCSNSNPKDLYIVDQSAKRSINASELKAINFVDHDFSSTSYDYIIITNKILEQGALEYKDYRESVEGGSYNVLIVYTDDLYEEYYYGYHHPMAIRNFCKQIYFEQSTPPTHILLLGKGQTYYRMRFDYTRRKYEDLVPTWGRPPSDYPFITEFTSNSLVPVMAIGRVPARNNAAISTYLDKVKLHEQQGNRSKTVLQLTGGFTATEQNLLQNYQNSYFNILKGEKLGADRISINKSQAVAIDSSLTGQIQSIINDGVAVVSYFGHGASQALELDMGRAKHFDNYGNYPLFHFNGCALGNSFVDQSLPEEFLLEEDNGAVAWIASSAFGLTLSLNNWSNRFYNSLVKDRYGYTIGEVIQHTIQLYQNPNDDYNRAQSRQMTYHGDPAIRIFAPDKPDYTLNASPTVYPDDANAELDSFALDLDIRNLGMATPDTLRVSIEVVYFNDSTQIIGPVALGKVYNRETFRVWIPNNEYSRGFITFNITLDPNDSIGEYPPDGELNNESQMVYFMPSNRLRIVSPQRDEIVPQGKVICTVQTSNLLEQSSEIYFEIDTTPDFNSPVLMQSGLVTGSNLISHEFILPPIDSTDFYWRARFNKPLDQGGLWENSSFAYIHNSDSGWSQGYYLKMHETEQKLIEMNDDNRSLNFLRTTSNKYTVVAGGSNVSFSSIGIIIDPYYYFTDFLRNGVALVAIDPNKLTRYSTPSTFNRIFARDWGIPGYTVGEYSGAYMFDTRSQEHRDSLVAHLHSIPEGYYLFLFTAGATAIDQWEDTLFQALEMFGAEDIRNVNLGDPYGLLGNNTFSIGEATELLADYNSVTDPRDQIIEYSIVLYPISPRGELTSKPVGPSRSWKQFYWRPDKRSTDSPKDSVHYDIIAVRANGSDTVYHSRTYASQIDLSDIDAAQFPYIKIKAYIQDSAELTPQNIKRWTLLYEGIPEGTLNPGIAFMQSHDTIQEGDSLEVHIAYENISNHAMDSVYVIGMIRNANSISDTFSKSYYPALDPGEHFVINYKISTRGLSGNNRFTVVVNPEFEQAEQSLENNVLDLRFAVEQDEKNPLLDVVFDGQHILEDDIVSPNTVITMSVLDENPYLFIDDPNSFDVLLTRPNGQVDTITHILDQVTFMPSTKPGEKAVLEYAANDLEGGRYTLSVVVTDASGNESSQMRYTIDFRVIRESTISNFYPYPNPFTTSMKFVYTLTGDQVPDYIKIQIMTVSGRIVREITKDELGTIRIGNNVSDFTWDGTDQFGDPLANGVYLYRVIAQIDGEQISLFETGGDQYFHQEGNTGQSIGKIYIMR